MISSDLAHRLIISLTKESTGNEAATALNNSEAAVAQSGFTLPALIVATNVSTTIDFAALAVGDYVVSIPASAGDAIFYLVATAGTLPAAAVVGDLYVVIRALSLPAPSAVKL